MNLERTCILFVKSLIHKNYLHVKIGEIRTLEFQLEIGQNAFFALKPYCMCSACYQLQHVQIWIQDHEIMKFKMENFI
jgi:hypothetical protein